MITYFELNSRALHLAKLLQWLIEKGRERLEGKFENYCCDEWPSRRLKQSCRKPANE